MSVASGRELNNRALSLVADRNDFERWVGRDAGADVANCRSLDDAVGLRTTIEEQTINTIEQSCQ
jgi:hypothetical protein